MRWPPRRLKFDAAIIAVATVAMFLPALIAFLACSNRAGGLIGLLLGSALTIKAMLVGAESGDVVGDRVILGIFATGFISLTGFVGGGPLMEIRRLHWEEQRQVSVAELPNHPEGLRFLLRDGTVDARSIHTRDHRHPGNEVSSYWNHAVAPVLPPGWRPGEPVHVWAVCYDFSTASSSSAAEKAACLENWRAPAGGAIVIDPDLEPCYRPAVPAQAVPSNGRLMFVEWVESPEGYIAEQWDEFLGIFRALGIAWGVIAGLWLLGVAVLG